MFICAIGRYGDENKCWAEIDLVFAVGGRVFVDRAQNKYAVLEKRVPAVSRLARDLELQTIPDSWVEL